MKTRRRFGIVTGLLLFVAPGAGGSLAACGRDADEGAPRRTGAAPATPSTTPPAVPPAGAPSGTTPPGVPPVPAAGAPRAAPIERWYEDRRDGQKLGWVKVVWAPSTWDGAPTIRDTTSSASRTVRKMMQVEDAFSTESTTETERGLDGTLWWSRSVTNENGARTTIAETRWVGDGYEWTQKVGDSEERRKVVLSSPVHVDPEALLAARLAAGGVKAGDRFVCRQLDVRGKRALELTMEVLGTEPGPGVAGDVPCTKVKVTEAATGTESTWWFDADGAAARMAVLGNEVVRVSEEKARQRPARPYSFEITSPSVPTLQRIFSAQRTLVDLHLQPDPARPLPEFPTSPWSRVLSVDGDARKGHVVHVELSAYDAPPGTDTAIPVTDAAFAVDLEPTALMPCDHVDVTTATRRAVGDAKTARAAAARIAAFVYTLRKQSGDVGEATALEILRDMQGDCSEHATLFVTMCRAAGIPARKCSGFVCVGSDWGAHAWAEIWVGAWMGVDPTTDDLGTAARYLFYGYDDRPDAKAGVVSARARGRMRLVTTRVEEGDDHVDLGGPETWTEVDPKARRARHHLLGLEARDWPTDWTVTMSSEEGCHVEVPEGRIDVSAMADQGMRGDLVRRFAGPSSRRTTFAGAPAWESRQGSVRFFVVSSRRRIVEVVVRSDGDAAALEALVAEAARVLAPTFTPVPKAP